MKEELSISKVPTILHICPPGSATGEEAVVAGEKFAGLPDC